MTDFDKVKNYYNTFNEKDRLTADSSGKLEFEMTMKILKKYLPSKGTILDLGGASGAYTFPLAKQGYTLYLADLSEKLIMQAKEKRNDEKIENIISCDVVNAIDLSIYKDEQFDVVLLFGPLYHLLEQEEREKCIKEVYRVLKKDGILFASFIPYLSGSIALIDRYLKHPEQVDKKNLSKVFDTGKFNNNDNKGFQEGYYPTSKELEHLFESHHFTKITIRSIRGFAYEKEDALYRIKDNAMFEKIMDLIEKTSNQQELIETCGHAIYVGKKL